MDHEQTRQLIRRLAFAVENVLEGSQMDDGWVNPSALNRLWEVYTIDIKPLGPERMPPADERSTADQCNQLRAALAGLIGAESNEDLEAMEVIIRLTPAPDADKVAMLNAIHALLSCKRS